MTMRDRDTIENGIKYGFLAAIEDAPDLTIATLHAWIAIYPDWEGWLRVAFALEMVERYAPEPPPDPVWEARMAEVGRRAFERAVREVDAERERHAEQAARLRAWRGYASTNTGT